MAAAASALKAALLLRFTTDLLLLYYCLLQGAFIEAIAAAAGALQEDVSIKSVSEVASRRGRYARRAGTSLQVSVEIKTKNTAAVMMVSKQHTV